MDVSDGLQERLWSVRSRIAEAAANAGRNPAEITTIVVTKFHPPELIVALAALGVHDVGESRHQEASVKAGALAELGLTWHFVGQVQSKKAKAIRAYARVVHSLDRASLVSALASELDEIDVYLQVNLDGDSERGAGSEHSGGRGGVRAQALGPLAEQILVTPGIRLVGVMGVAPLGGQPRASFAELRAASERLRTIAPKANQISAGMSHDFAEAIAEGATHLRIGTAITGNRPTHR